MECEHWVALVSKRPHTSRPKAVYKEECMYCFSSWEEPGWIEVCAVCFQGFCSEHFIHHLASHSAHECSVRTSMREIKDVDDDREAQEVTKEPRIETLPPIYDYTFYPFCHRCQRQLLTNDDDPIVKIVKESVKASLVVESSSVQSANTCQHISNMQQCPQTCSKPAQFVCSKCPMTDNLWMCLCCGEIGCGRRQFDGSGGNGHASDHYSHLRHPCSVKLGTLNHTCPDVHCYECDDLIKDDQLEDHLTILNVDLLAVNHEKAMSELQWEHNQRFEFSMATDDGKEMESASGLSGIYNLGNSCYMSSVLQPVVRLLHGIPQHEMSLCISEPKDCLQCQFQKIKSALNDSSTTTPPLKIKPWMFKKLISRGNAEFSSSHQQDAAEFFTHLLDRLKLSGPFSFNLKQTISCEGCGNTKTSQTPSDYLQTDISQLITSQKQCSIEQVLEESFFAKEKVALGCAKCGAVGVCSKKFSLTSGPKECLVVVIGRCAIKDSVPVKVDFPVWLSSELDISKFFESPVEFLPDQESIGQLTSMGFTAEQAISALSACDNSLEEALNSLLSGKYPDNSDAAAAVSEEDIVELASMGFAKELCRRALIKTNNDKEAACELLLTDSEPCSNEKDSASVDLKNQSNDGKYELKAFVSHRGPSLHCGHYVCHVFDDKTQRWALFNDERVVYATRRPCDLPDTSNAYIAFYTKS